MVECSKYDFQAVEKPVTMLCKYSLIYFAVCKVESISCKANWIILSDNTVCGVVNNCPVTVWNNFISF